MAKPTAPVAADKSLSMAYLLWAFGGPWGLHHIYLARYRHAFLWVTTMGGFLGIGWLRDVWRLPDYVAEYNAGSEYAERMVLMTKLHHKPPLSMARISAQLVFGCLVGVAVMAGLPQDLIAGNLGRLIMALLVPLCCALGKYELAFVYWHISLSKIYDIPLNQLILLFSLLLIIFGKCLLNYFFTRILRCIQAIDTARFSWLGIYPGDIRWIINTFQGLICEISGWLQHIIPSYINTK